ncbi:sugar kinase [Alteribacter populi]|uniref:sugar kinase n=1 Tax=Alteribacter populi TaxID=2011011 RepID=UPI000BBA9C87|nr:sugar kinase [Alteribacter populi]
MTVSSTIDVVTIGESMVLFQPMQEGQIKYAPLFTNSIGGAESNLALALSRLGMKTRWISRVGQDPFGEMILSTLSGEGVDVSRVVADDSANTAVFFKETKGFGDPNVYYFRKRSAASKLSIHDIQENWFHGAKHLHVTGITPALSENAEEMVREAMRQARSKGMTISFDPNIRKKLWSEQKSREVILSLLPLCDVFLPGVDEAEFLLGEMTEEDYMKAFQEMGPPVIALKLGEKGAIARYFEHNHIGTAYKVKQIVDTVGAGDAFAAGFLSVLLNQPDPLSEPSLKESFPHAIARANVMGALATQYKGDWEGVLTLEELEGIMCGKQKVTR